MEGKAYERKEYDFMASFKFYSKCNNSDKLCEVVLLKNILNNMNIDYFKIVRGMKSKIGLKTIYDLSVKIIKW